MNLTVIDGNIFLFTFDTQKELVLSLFRPQEFYESENKKLYNKNFTFFEFLDENIDKDGNINYFSFWNGFNIPDIAYLNWLNFNKESLTSYEDVIFQEMKPYLELEEFYIIGTISGDEETINHEMAHALFKLNKSYRNSVYTITAKFELEHKHIFNRITKHLKQLGYRHDVIEDEVQAYFSAENEDYLCDEFGINNFNEIRPIVEQYRNTLRQYNVNLITELTNIKQNDIIYSNNLTDKYS